jgi:hypothetical protein
MSLRTARCGIDASLQQDLPDRRWGDLDPEHEEFAVHPPVTPAGVLLCQPQDEGAD